jgi:hypothetical protein
MPKATRNQGDLRFPTKKEALSAPRLVITEMRISRLKYTATMSNSIQGFISEELVLLFARILKTINPENTCRNKRLFL